MALLGRAEITPEAMDERCEHIRRLMLTEFKGCCTDRQSSTARRIRYATDAQGLWYVRSELMAILASAHGETVAARKIALISSMFQGLLPASQTDNPNQRPR